MRRAIAADSSARSRRRRRLRDVYLSPRSGIPRRAWLAVAVIAFVTIIGVWAAVAIAVDTPILLPGPVAVVQAWIEMFRELGFARDVGWSAFRVVGGFVLAAAIAVPLGIVMGTFEITRAFFEPPINAIRYMPASAFIPLLILLQGLGEDEKLTVIWIGVFFPLVLMVVDTAHRVPIEMLHTAYTLGASRWAVLRKVLLRAMLPDVVDALRITMGWAWTYLIVAELVAATAGIGYFILVAQRYLRSDRIIAAILTIGVLGLVTDLLFALVYRYAFPYVEKVRR